MAAPAVKEQLVKAVEEVQTYVDSSTDYVRLQGFKLTMRLITTLGKILMVTFLALLSLLFLSLSAASALGELLGNMAYGLLIVGGIYVLIAILSYIFRDRLDKPLLRNFSDLYFKE